MGPGTCLWILNHRAAERMWGHLHYLDGLHQYLMAQGSSYICRHTHVHTVHCCSVDLFHSLFSQTLSFITRDFVLMGCGLLLMLSLYIITYSQTIFCWIVQLYALFHAQWLYTFVGKWRMRENLHVWPLIPIFATFVFEVHTFNTLHHRHIESGQTRTSSKDQTSTIMSLIGDRTKCKHIYWSYVRWVVKVCDIVHKSPKEEFPSLLEEPFHSASFTSYFRRDKSKDIWVSVLLRGQ